MTGLPVFYNDAVAYIGNISLLANSTKATNVNFTLSGEELTATAIQSSQNTTLVLDSPTLAIDVSSDALDSAIFETSTTSGYSHSGFLYYGAQIVWLASGVLESKWVAETTDTDGLWVLKWAANGGTEDELLVVLKNLAPVALTA
ncbi:hypothetical protein LTR36_004206 [Oleoguttula mirabilis]|uniref:Uncharacterized protein n=1 Tax=Oleoguttula mirabilis TaxID=1507867 RepID=A0AAV9JGJ8_9PEZI|nr:hypothetical protein LTR36_004206 [Oleoguttula mirabilis]